MQSGKANMLNKGFMMIKALFILLITFSLCNATEMGLKGGSCTLAQEGKVTLNYNNKFYNDVMYIPNAKSGKNFREILVGSVFNVDNSISIKIIDYVPNKRVKGKPKTGVFSVEITTDSLTKNSTMSYIFDAGIMSATGVVNKTTIGFWTKIKYTLCSVTR